MSKYLEGLLPDNGLEWNPTSAPHEGQTWGLYGLKTNGPGISEPNDLPDGYYEEIALRPELLAVISEDEGCKYEVYLDHLGYPTVGIGHLIKADDAEVKLEVGDAVTKERVEELFVQDIQIACRDCVNLYGWSGFCEWPEEVQNININMVFNMGMTRLSKFKNMHKALESQDWAKAAVEGRDSKWYKQVTNRAERLMRRLEDI